MQPGGDSMYDRVATRCVESYYEPSAVTATEYCTYVQYIVVVADTLVRASGTPFDPE